MNKIKAGIIGIVLPFIFGNTALAFGPNVTTSEERVSLSHKYSSEDQLLARLLNMPSLVDIKVTRKVKEQIKRYTEMHPSTTCKLLGRTNVYFPLILDKLIESDMPVDLANVVIIESSVRPNAISKVGATGMWQFMKGTAKENGLVVNSYVDERRDPSLATDAAIKYMKKLYKRFGDWSLVIAAYNCGPGRVSKAIRQANSTSYWDLERYLPKETRNYIPKFIATTYLMNYHHLHDIQASQHTFGLHGTASTKVYSKVNFSVISNITGLKKEMIKNLNPAYIKNIIPSNTNGHKILLPQEECITLINHMNLIDYSGPYIKNAPKEARAEVVLSFLPTVQIKNNNPASSPIEVKGLLATEAIMESYEYYIIKRRESLYTLSQKRTDLDLTEIIALNDLDLNNPPLPGTKIKLKKL